jgi:hypothetical protein
LGYHWKRFKHILT